MLKSLDRIKELTSTSGTGTLTLTGAESGFQAFSVLGNGTKCYYTITDVNTIDFEIGEAIYNDGTLSRDTIFESSNSGNKISLSATGSTVFVTYPAEKSSYRDIGVNRDYEATGSITAGKPLILNADNTVSQVGMVSGTKSFEFSKGSATALVSSNTGTPITSCFDISAQRFILVYTNQDASNYLYGNIIEVDSNNAVTSKGIDTIISTSNGGEYQSIVYDSANEKSMLVYASGPNSNDLRGKVLTATASTISVGAEVIINDNDNSGTFPKVVYEPTSGKLVVSYLDQSNSSYVTAQVGTISGTTSSWSSNSLISGAGTATQIGIGAGNGKVLFLTTDDSNNGDARAGIISGTTLTLGSAVEFDADNATNPYPSSDRIVCYDTQNDRFFAGYEGTADSLYGMVFQISGTTVTHGVRNLIKYKGNDFVVPDSSDIGKIPLTFGVASTGSPANGKYYREATIDSSDNSITYNTDVTLNTTDTDASTLAYDSTNVRLLSSYHLNSPIDNIEAYGIVPNGSRAGLVSNLSTNNFFGVASSTNTESVSFTITVQNVGGSNYYFVNGVRQQMPIALKKGSTYKFIQSDSSNSNHPLRFSTTSDGTWGGGTEYTSGVTVVGTAGQSGAYTQIVVADSTPSQLYSYCTNHSGMGFGVSIISQPVGVNRAGSFSNDQSGMTAGKDMYVTDAGLIKQRTSTTTAPSATPTTKYDSIGQTDQSTNSSAPAMTYEATSGKYVMYYTNNQNSTYPTISIGTWSNGTITWGTAIVITSLSNADQLPITSGDGRIYMLVQNYPSFNSMQLCVGTISGNSFSQTFRTTIQATATAGQKIAYSPTQNQVIMVYSRNNGGEKGYARTASISSSGALTAIGSEVLIENTNFHTNRASLTYDPNTDRALYASFNGAQGDDGYAWVIQASGSAASPTVAVGTGTTWAGSTNVSHTASCYDAEYNKIFIAYKISNENRGIIATINAGTNAVTFAGDKTITGVISYNSSLFSVAYDVDAKKITYFYRDGSNSDYLTYKTITSGASSFTVANGAVLKNADIRMGPNSGASGTTGKGIALATSDTDTSPTGQLGYSSSYYGSITTTVVNASQFVGTARSGSDLELTELTELVGMANGSITKGKPVIVQTDGDFQQVGIQSSSTTNTGSFSQGSLQTITGFGATGFSMAVSGDGLTYGFFTSGSANRLEIVIGTRVSGANTISWGTPLLIAPNYSAKTIITHNDEENVFVCTYGKNSNYVYATAVSYSGNTPTKGTEVTALSLGTNWTEANQTACYQEDIKANVVVAQGDGTSSNNYLSFAVLTCSGTTITVGTNQAFSVNQYTAGWNYVKANGVNDSKIAVYITNSSRYPTVLMASISGTTFTLGTPVVINSATAYEGFPCFNETYPNKFIIGGNLASYKVSYCGVSFSGLTPTISNFSDGNVNNANSLVETAGEMTVYSNYSGNYCFVYQNNSPSNSCYRFATTTDGVSLTVGAEVVTTAHGSSQYYAGACCSDSDGFVAENHKDNPNSNCVSYTFQPTFSFTVTTSAPNLTASNFIGFAQQTVADDEDVKIKIVSQTDENQSSLVAASQYFVQTDGSLSTTAGSPSVIGGTALSSTKILIKS